MGRSDALPFALAAALLGLMLASLTLGRYAVPLAEVVRILVTTWPFAAVGSADDTAWVVVVVVRLPRVLLVVLCGMTLALAGTTLQGVFRNPLVGPEVSGVSAGAMFGGALAILLGLASAGTVGLAFLFGLGAMGLAFGLARLARGGTLALVLAGVVVGAFFGALVGLTQYVADPQTRLPSIVYWLLGSFAGADYPRVAIAASALLLAGVPLLALRWRLNLLSLGETDAAALGVTIGALRWGMVSLAALLVAAQVSVSGGVSWIGLVVPHLARMLAGPEHGRLLPVSALLGGLILLAMDDIARSAGDQEIPIGLLTAVTGTPIFAVLFWKLQGRGWDHG